jgi:hypothetical protein
MLSTYPLGKGEVDSSILSGSTTQIFTDSRPFFSLNGLFRGTSSPRSADSRSRPWRSPGLGGDGPRDTRHLLGCSVIERNRERISHPISFAPLRLAKTRNDDLAVEGRPGPGAVIVRIAFRPRRHAGRKLVAIRPGASRLKRRPRPDVPSGRRLWRTLASRLLVGMRCWLQRPPERSRRYCCDRHMTQPRDTLHSRLHESLLC